MDCKFALVVLCLFVVSYVDAAPSKSKPKRSLWDLLSGSDENFFLVNTTSSKDGDNIECTYMKRKYKDDSRHELLIEMAHRKKGETSFRDLSNYTVAATKGSESKDFSEMTFKRRSGSTDGFKYGLVYSDDNGCNILEMKPETETKVTKKSEKKECELWAPPGKVTHALGGMCTQKFKRLCKPAVVESPYNETCEIPETAVHVPSNC
uniref:Putative salivary lipocalin n=1 Tax=Ornithodoros turicata TaxID=34597 RepID=A0A2R5LGR8_9ACAR